MRAGSTRCRRYELTLLWQQLVSFIQIRCNWLHPGGTPGSNILIKLICEILTMWVFRWLVIWCERSLCFHFQDTGGAGTCFSEKRCRKLSLSTYPECEQLQMTVFVFLLMKAKFHRIVFFSPPLPRTPHHHLRWQPVKVFLPRPSPFVSNLLRIIRNSHQVDYDNESLWGNEKVSAAFAFIQMFFHLVTQANTRANTVVKVPQHKGPVHTNLGIFKNTFFFQTLVKKNDFLCTQMAI